MLFHKLVQAVKRRNRNRWRQPAVFTSDVSYRTNQAYGAEWIQIWDFIGRFVFFARRRRRFASGLAVYPGIVAYRRRLVRRWSRRRFACFDWIGGPKGHVSRARHADDFG